MTTFEAYLEDQKRRARAALIADVFRTEGMEGLVRRGLAPDPRTDSQFQRPTLGEAGGRVMEALGEPAEAAFAATLTKLLPAINPYIGEAPAIIEMQRKEKELQGQRFYNSSPALEAYRRTDLPSAQVPVLPFSIPLPGGRSFQKVGVGLKGLGELVVDPFNLAGAPEKITLKVGELAAKGTRGAVKAATSPPVRAALRDQRGAIRIPGSTPEELPLPGEVPTRGAGVPETPSAAAPVQEDFSAQLSKAYNERALANYHLTRNTPADSVYYHGTSSSAAKNILEQGEITSGDFTPDFALAKTHADKYGGDGVVFAVKASDVGPLRGGVSSEVPFPMWRTREMGRNVPIIGSVPKAIPTPSAAPVAPERPIPGIRRTTKAATPDALDAALRKFEAEQPKAPAKKAVRKPKGELGGFLSGIEKQLDAIEAREAATPPPAAARQAPPALPKPVGAAPAPVAGRVTPAPAPAALPVQPATAQGAGGTPPPAQPPVAPGATPPDPIKKFAAFIHSPESLNLAEETVRVRKKQVAERATAYSEQLNTYIEQGMKMEEAQRKALEAMSGKYDRPLTTVSEDLTNEFRDSLFTRVHEVLRNEPLEEMATNEALTNALTGKGIPRIAGTKGGSAYTRLSRVFPPEVLDSLQSGKPLRQLVEERMVGAGGAKAPEETVRWTLNVPKLEDLAEAEKANRKWSGEQLGLSLPPSVGRFAEKFYPPGPALDEFEIWRLRHGLSIDEPMRYKYKFSDVPKPPDDMLWSPQQGWLIPEEGLSLPPVSKPTPEEIRRRWSEYLDLQRLDAKEKAARIEAHARAEADRYSARKAASPQGAQRTMFDAPIEKEIKQPSIVPLEHRNLIARVAKDIGLTAVDTVNLIRANRSSFDFSFWRQMFPLIFNNKRSFAKANVAGLKALKDADFAKAVDRRIKSGSDPDYLLYQQIEAANFGKGTDFLRPLDQKGLPVWQREENFLIMGGQRPIEKFSEKIPWIRWSQRSFVTATNTMTWDMWKGYLKRLRADELKMAAGRMKAPEGGFSVLKEATDYAKMLADMSGRAGLGPVKELSKELNAGIFSMRLTLGRAITPRHLFSKNPRIRVEAWKNIGSAVAVTTSVLLLGKQLGLWEIELDPRSADFMKLRIGKTRIDPWGGYQQFVVLYSRLISGKQRSSQTGRVRPTSFWETAGRFAESKESPGVGLATELLTQETYLGDKVDIKNPHQWSNRLAPMVIDDVYEAVSETGSWGAAIAIPSALGLGAGTYNAPPELISRAETAKYHAIPSNDREAKAKKMPTREDYRAKHPDVDAQLFLAGDVTSLKTMAARTKVLQYMRQNKLKVSDIRALEEEEYESASKATLRRWFQRALGETTQSGTLQSIGPQRMTRQQELAESAARKARLATAGAR